MVETLLELREQFPTFLVRGSFIFLAESSLILTLSKNRCLVELMISLYEIVLPFEDSSSLLYFCSC